MSARDYTGVSDADGHGLSVCLLDAERLNASTKAFGDLCGTVNPCAGEYRNELISSVTCDEIAGTIHGTRNCRADLLQTFVPGGVSLGVVIGLESIDIEHDQR